MLAVVAAGCTSTTGDDAPPPAPRTSATSDVPALSLTSLGIDWPRVGSTLDVSAVPSAPEGFDDALLGRMADVLEAWATATTTDPDVWQGDAPVDTVTATLPAKAGAALRQQTADAVSPELGVANVFGDDVTVVGEPRVTTAWKVSTQDDDSGQQYVLLELQTRAAYEVRLGDDGPTQVVGVLRVHGLSAYPGTTDDFGVSGGWQEFGASDCALALDDDLVPANDSEDAADDLATFADVGGQPSLRMPALDSDEQVDEAYLQRCRDSTT